MSHYISHTPLERTVLDKDKAGLVDGPLWAFSPQNKKDHKGDYHKVFNGQNYIKWIKEQLLPNLHQPSLIHLDNAKYHKTFGMNVPKAYKLKRWECELYLAMEDIDYDPEMSCVELKALIRDYVNENIPLEVVRLCEEAGHRVLWTPPYHSDFQPIELVWALVKGNVGRQYSNDTTLSVVYERLLAEFETLQSSGHDSINGMIEACTKICRSFYDEIELEDEIQNLEEEADSSDDAASDDSDEEDVQDNRGNEQQAEESSVARYAAV